MPLERKQLSLTGRSLVGPNVPVEFRRRQEWQSGRRFGGATASESGTDSTRSRATLYPVCVIVSKLWQRSFECSALKARMNRHFREKQKAVMNDKISVWSKNKREFSRGPWPSDAFLALWASIYSTGISLVQVRVKWRICPYKAFLATDVETVKQPNNSAFRMCDFSGTPFKNDQ